MITFAGIVGEQKDDYYTVWFWDPDDGKELDFPIAVDFIPEGVECGDLIWIGTTTEGSLIIKKRDYIIPSDDDLEIDILAKVFTDNIPASEQTNLERFWDAIRTARYLQKILYFFTSILKAHTNEDKKH